MNISKIAASALIALSTVFTAAAQAEQVPCPAQTQDKKDMILVVDIDKACTLKDGRTLETVVKKAWEQALSGVEFGKLTSEQDVVKILNDDFLPALNKQVRESAKGGGEIKGDPSIDILGVAIPVPAPAPAPTPK